MVSDGSTRFYMQANELQNIAIIHGGTKASGVSFLGSDSILWRYLQSASNLKYLSRVIPAVLRSE